MECRDPTQAVPCCKGGAPSHPSPRSSAPPRLPPAGSRAALTLDGAEAPALILAVVLGGGTPQVPVLTACAGAAVEPLVVILEGDGARFPVGVSLDGVDLCKEGAGPWHLDPRGCPPPITQGAGGRQGSAAGEGGSGARQWLQVSLCRQISPGAWERFCCSPQRLGRGPQCLSEIQLGEGPSMSSREA